MHETKMFALGEVKAVEDAEGDPNGEFDVILSAPTLDRDGEVIDAKVFDPLPDHITFDIDHGMSTATTVGSGVPEYLPDGRLRVKGTYSSIPRAQEVRTLVREGHIRTTSVAFMGAVREEKDGVAHIVKAELLNGAFVPIPSNRESVVLSAKNFAAAIKAGARNSTKDAERLQSIHDLTVENGADCVVAAPEKAAASRVTRKAHGMSANSLREALDAALRETYGGEDTYVWVRDYDDAWVVFEISQPDDYTLYKETYAVTDGTVALAGDKAEVVARTTYESTAAPSDSTTAPEAPSDEDGKSPASNVVEMARIRADIARLSLD